MLGQAAEMVENALNRFPGAKVSGIGDAVSMYSESIAGRARDDGAAPDPGRASIGWMTQEVGHASRPRAVHRVAGIRQRCGARPEWNWRPAVEESVPLALSANGVLDVEDALPEGT